MLFVWSQGYIRAPVEDKTQSTASRCAGTLIGAFSCNIPQEKWSGRTRSDILSLLLPREVHFLGKHSCQGHTASIRHERASPKPIVFKTGKRQAMGFVKVSLRYPSQGNRNLGKFLISSNLWFNASMLLWSIVGYIKTCDWDRTRCDSLRVLLPFSVHSGKTPVFTCPAG